MSTAAPAARTGTLAGVGVPVPRPAPAQENRRRHDGWYWDVDACAWRPCVRSPGTNG